MVTPYLQIRNDCLLYYSLNDYRGARNIVPITKPAYSGQVTEGAKKRIQKAIDILVQKSPTRMKFNPVTGKYFPFRISFATLTFSTKKLLDTKEIYRTMLKPLLRKLRKRDQFSYVWKAEFQSNVDYQGKHKEHGGQLHYHIASNQVIPWNVLRKEWNHLQRKNGHLEEFGLRFGHYNPNSVDIHSTYKVQNLAAYLGKYMGKDDRIEGKEGTEYEGKKVDGKVWDCSTDLKKQRFSFELSSYTEDKIKAAVDRKEVQQINLEHCTIFKTKEPLRFLSPYVFKDYLNWRDNIIKSPPKTTKMKEPVLTLNEKINLKVNEAAELQAKYFKALHLFESLDKGLPWSVLSGYAFDRDSLHLQLKNCQQDLKQLYIEKAKLSNKVKQSSLF